MASTFPSSTARNSKPSSGLKRTGHENSASPCPGGEYGALRLRPDSSWGFTRSASCLRLDICPLYPEEDSQVHGTSCIRMMMSYLLRVPFTFSTWRSKEATSH